MLAIGEPAFSLRKKSATERKRESAAQSDDVSPETGNRQPVEEEKRDPDQRHRDDQPIDPRSALTQIPAPDQRDVNRRGVLQEDRIRGSRHSRREDKEHDRAGVAERAADLGARKGEPRPPDAEQDHRNRDRAPAAGDRHRRPIDRLDEDAAETPAKRGEEQEKGGKKRRGIGSLYNAAAMQSERTAQRCCRSPVCRGRCRASRTWQSRTAADPRLARVGGQNGAPYTDRVA